MAKRKHDRCDADTMRKCWPYLAALGHFHEEHSGHKETVTQFVAPRDMQEYPDVFIVTDPAARLLFQELAEKVRAKESKSVQELERMYRLDTDQSTTGSARQKPRPVQRPSGQ